MENPPHSLSAFERQVADCERQAALETGLRILDSINNRYGNLTGVEFDDIRLDNAGGAVPLVFCTRFAASFGQLLIDPDLTISNIEYERLLINHRWIDLIFTLSGFRSSDHFLRRLGSGNGKNGFTVPRRNLPRFLAMLTLNSRIAAGVGFDQLWEADKIAAAPAFITYLRTRYVFQQRAFDYREKLLAWLPGHLSGVTLGGMTLSRLQDAYMHSSYAVAPSKHKIKVELMAQLRRACVKAGVQELNPEEASPTPERPTVVIVCEEIKFDHSIYRTHSLSMRSLRERFNVVGFVHGDQVGPEVNDLFDETVVIPEIPFFQMIRKVSEEIRRRSPSAIFYPSLGMRADIIALASLRLAPIQCASYGHAASTMSPAIDYMVLPEDFAGSPDSFSEKLVPLPPTAMPFRPRSHKRALPKMAADRKTDGIVRIGIPSSVMKLNPIFFETLKKIAANAKTPVEFHFFPLGAIGIAYEELARVLRVSLPQSTVFRQLPFDNYLEKLSKCEFILCPFPYGNTNSIVDAVMVGLPGICLDGPEPHSHIDVGLFQRMGLPDQLSAKTIDDYVGQAVKMIDDEEWRVACRSIAFNCDLDKTFYDDNSSAFCDAITKLVWPKGAPTSA